MSMLNYCSPPRGFFKNSPLKEAITFFTFSVLFRTRATPGFKPVSVSAGETHLLLRRGGLGHVGAAGPEEQNKEAAVCRPQRHQTLEGWGRIHLDSRRERDVDQTSCSEHFNKT